MAQNPLLLRTLAIIHRNNGHLPQSRVDLYEMASRTLIQDWQLEQKQGLSFINEFQAISLLSPVALWMHEHRASGHIEQSEVMRIMQETFANRKGEKLSQLSIKTQEEINSFLEVVRRHSSLFVERGEGLYGFIHLTFEEYFSARQMVSNPEQTFKEITQRIHQPRWREPILLAMGLLNKTFYESTTDILFRLLDLKSDYESILHRDLIFVADYIRENPMLPILYVKRLLQDYYKFMVNLTKWDAINYLKDKSKTQLLLLKKIRVMN